MEVLREMCGEVGDKEGPCVLAIMRAYEERLEHNPSGGYTVHIPWHKADSRELSVAECLDIAKRRAERDWAKKGKGKRRRAGNRGPGQAVANEASGEAGSEGGSSSSTSTTMTAITRAATTTGSSSATISTTPRGTTRTNTYDSSSADTTSII